MVYSLLETQTDGNIFDQFVVSHGLYYGKEKLQIMLDSVELPTSNGLRLVDNLPPDRFL